jgi:hypothetical protein
VSDPAPDIWDQAREHIDKTPENDAWWRAISVERPEALARARDSLHRLVLVLDLDDPKDREILPIAFRRFAKVTSVEWLAVSERMIAERNTTSERNLQINLEQQRLAEDRRSERARVELERVTSALTRARNSLLDLSCAVAEHEQDLSDTSEEQLDSALWGLLDFLRMSETQTLREAVLERIQRRRDRGQKPLAILADRCTPDPQ